MSKIMAKKLPPLNALKAFLAAANNLSFTKAAAEIGITQGAISKQIKILEEFLGLTLFERKHQHLLLTKSGKIYLKAMNKAFCIIEQATSNLTDHHEEKEVLNINVFPSFSTCWLTPRLENFRKNYPYKINIQTGDGMIDFDKTNADVAIRVTEKNIWKKFHVEKFMGEDLLPVCSPKLKVTQPINNLRDLAKHNLILDTTRPTMWEEYFAALGYKIPTIEYKLSAEHFFILIQAAKDALGIVLVPRALIEKELQQGSLVIALKTNFKSNWNHYCFSPKQKARLKKVKDFQRWIAEVSA